MNLFLGGSMVVAGFSLLPIGVIPILLGGAWIYWAWLWHYALIAGGMD